MSYNIDNKIFEDENRYVTAQIAASRAYTSGHKHTGECLNCGKEVLKPKLYCNGVCADNHAKKTKSR